MPEIERESEEELTPEELAQMVEKVDEVISEYDQKIEDSSDVAERKALKLSEEKTSAIYRQRKIEWNQFLDS